MDRIMRTHHLEHRVLRFGSLDGPCGRAAGRRTLRIRFSHVVCWRCWELKAVARATKLLVGEMRKTLE